MGEKLKEILHIFRASGTPDYTFVDIDTTSFEHDGILHIEIQVGSGEATGSFELFDGDKELATNESPDDVLTGTWDIPPGGTGKIFHRFKRGQRFKLGATSLDSEKGSTNAFIARILVVQEGEEVSRGTNASTPTRTKARYATEKITTRK